MNTINIINLIYSPTLAEGTDESSIATFSGMTSEDAYKDAAEYLYEDDFESESEVLEEYDISPEGKYYKDLFERLIEHQMEVGESYIDIDIFKIKLNIKDNKLKNFKITKE